MSEDEPKIVFKNLKGFPQIDDNKIQTASFLEASKEIVSVLETFGKLLTPIVYDMNGNIEKIEKCYKKDTEAFYYLDNLILKNIATEYSYVGCSLLWLKRALELIAAFFENILNTNADSLKECLKIAYDKTLKQYHGWLIRNTFSIIYHWIPTRSTLIGQGEIHDENIKILEKFVPLMKEHLDTIDILLKENDLDDNKQV